MSINFEQLSIPQQESLKATLTNGIMSEILENAPEIRDTELYNISAKSQTYSGAIAIIKKILSEVDSPVKDLKLYSEHNVEYDHAPLITYSLDKMVPGSVSRATYKNVKDESTFTREMIPKVVGHYKDIEAPGSVYAIMVSKRDAFVTFKTISNYHAESTNLAIALFDEFLHLRSILRQTGIPEIMPLEIGKEQTIESGGEKLILTPVVVLIRYSVIYKAELKQLLEIVCKASLFEDDTSSNLLPKIEFLD